MSTSHSVEHRDQEGMGPMLCAPLPPWDGTAQASLLCCGENEWIGNPGPQDHLPLNG